MDTVDTNNNILRILHLSASPSGESSRACGVGVRVMVPVLDMFNHAGDEVRNLLTSHYRGCDNCRWQAVAPENNPTNEWVMQVRPPPDQCCTARYL